jgi:hypothetical protein
MDGMSINGILTAVATYNRAKQGKENVYPRQSKKRVRKPTASSYIIEIVGGQFPAHIAAAAEVTCEGCVMFQEPMSMACNECPAVTLARILVKSVEVKALQ